MAVIHELFVQYKECLVDTVEANIRDCRRGDCTKLRKADTCDLTNSLAPAKCLDMLLGGDRLSTKELVKIFLNWCGPAFQLGSSRACNHGNILYPARMSKDMHGYAVT